MIPENIIQTPAGRLILVGGAHGVSDMFAGKRKPSPSSIIAFHDNIESRADLCKRRGVGYRHYVMPDPLVLANQEMDHGNIWTSYFERYFQNVNNNVVYPASLLAGKPERQRLTDTHYSPTGSAHIAADIAARMIGCDASSILDAALATGEDATLSGDLAVQCDPVPKETVVALAQIDQLRHATNGLAAGNFGIIDLAISPLAASDRTLLIFGDSFFRSMVPELSRYWRKIVFVRTPYVHVRMIDAVAPHDILTGGAERYLSQVTLDADAPDFLAMPLIAERGTQPTKNFAALFGELIDVKRLNGNAAPMASPRQSWPSADCGPEIEEQLAFALWLQRDAGASSLKGEDRAIAWLKVRAEWRVASAELLSHMHRRGLRVSMAAH